LAILYVSGSQVNFVCILTRGRKYISFLIRLCLGMLFVISGISKSLDINYIRLSIENFDIFPKSDLT
jgi:hypothetical protein